MQGARLFHGLTAVERAHLRELTTLFLRCKSFSGAQGLSLSEGMKLAVAAQACLPILKLDLSYYDGWIEVLIYPGAFRVERDVTDATGVVSREERALGGESWLQGPVILAWDTVASDLGTPRLGHNLVVHEFAHKLDMLNGRANGMPPLHAGMRRERWTQAFSAAFERLQHQVAHHHAPALDPYAATAPAEFFAVSSEYFFTAPAVLRHEYPDVYGELARFYRQNPATRLADQPG